LLAGSEITEERSAALSIATSDAQLTYNFSDMPRKRKKSTNANLLFAVIFVAFCILLLRNIRFQDVMAFVVFLGASVLLVTALVIALKIAIPRARRDNLVSEVDSITDRNIDALVRQRITQIRNDPYGKPMLDKWNAELEYFIKHHVRPAINPSLLQIFDKERSAILQRISGRVANAAQQRPALTDVPSKMAPAEFETFCAERLRACGWQVQVTSLCRDQGVDVLAEKNGVRVALQCKLYSNPVGNKAVQEVVAGRVHQQAGYGVVVTNNTFTSSAKQLAATNGIHLLHHTDLPQLEELLGRTVVR
jgi:restriction system protein